MQERFNRAKAASQEERRRRELQQLADVLQPGLVVGDTNKFEDFLGVTAARMSVETGKPPEQILDQLYAEAQSERLSAGQRYQQTQQVKQQQQYEQEQAKQQELVAQSQALTAIAQKAFDPGQIQSDPNVENIRLTEIARNAGVKSIPGFASSTNVEQANDALRTAIATRQRLLQYPLALERQRQATGSVGASIVTGLSVFGAATDPIGEVFAQSGAQVGAEHLGPVGGVVGGLVAGALGTPQLYPKGTGALRGVAPSGEAFAGVRAPVRGGRAVEQAARKEIAGPNLTRSIPTSIRMTFDSISPIGTADAAGPPPKPKIYTVPAGVLQGSVDRAGAVGVGADNQFGVRELAAELPEISVSLEQSLRNRALNATPERFKSSAAGRRLILDSKEVFARAVTDPVFKFRKGVINNGNSQGAALASQLGPEYRRAFSPNSKGQIESLAGIDKRLPTAPTVQDVAARLDTFKPHLSKRQVDFLERLRKDLAPYRQILEETGDEISTRLDIEGDGFYIPRGGALDDSLQPQPISRRPGATPGSERHAKYESQAHGIYNNEEYANFEAAVRGFVQSAARRTADNFSSNYLKTVRDVDGTRFGLTLKELMLRERPLMVKKMEGLRKFRDSLYNMTKNRADLELKAFDHLVDDPAFDDIEGVRNLLTRVRLDVTKGGSAKVGVQQRTILGAREATADVSRARVRAAKKRTVSRGRFKGLSRDELLDELEAADTALADFKRDFDKAMKDIAHETGYGQIGRLDEFPQLNGTYFPERMARRATDLIAKEGAREQSTIRTIRMAQDVWKGINATLDDSGVGIQTLIVAYNDPKAFKDALWANLRAIVTRNAQGDFFEDFDTKAASRGTLTVRQWTDSGLRVLDANEFDVTSTLPERIPILGKGFTSANRAFSTVSNTARLGWADDLLMEEIVKGRSIDEIIASGDMRRIANAVNMATGIVDGNFSVANLVTFSARFMASRFKTIFKAAKGFDIDAPLDLVPYGGRFGRRFGVNPWAELDDKLARRSILRLIGVGTFLTASINELNGEKTDYRPFVGGKSNPNFMRVRAFGRDYSVFGPWDSIARLITTASTGEFSRTARTMASAPFPQLALGGILNKDFYGRPIFRPTKDIYGRPIKGADGKPVRAGFGDLSADLLAYVGQSMIPFAADDAPETMNQLIASGKDGKFDALGIGAFSAVSDSLGIKSSELSNSDIRALLEQDEDMSPQTRKLLEDTLEQRKAAFKTGAYQRNPINILLGRDNPSATRGAESKYNPNNPENPYAIPGYDPNYQPPRRR